MKKIWLYLLLIILLAGGAYAAYWGGTRLKTAKESVPEETQTGLRGTGWQNPPSVADITLTLADGTAFKLGDLQGNITVVFFGYTRCPDICPLTMSKLAQIYADLGEPKDLKVVLISVDPQTDTPEVIQNYASNFNPAFIGLSGDNSQVAAAIQSFYIAAQDLKNGTFAHTDALIILDRQSRLRLIYAQDNVDYLREDLKTVLSQADW
jgi:protein SCO1